MESKIIQSKAISINETNVEINNKKEYEIHLKPQCKKQNNYVENWLKNI
jgi:hypothetical protein